MTLAYFLYTIYIPTVKLLLLVAMNHIYGLGSSLFNKRVSLTEIK